MIHLWSGQATSLDVDSLALVTGRYELKQQKSEDPALTLFQRRWFGKSVSELRIRPAAVLRSDMPQARYEIELALRRAEVVT